MASGVVRDREGTDPEEGTFWEEDGQEARHDLRDDGTEPYVTYERQRQPYCGSKQQSRP